jgi:NTP pyrophosphatase (non-canonical NTP hydrolase)
VGEVSTDVLKDMPALVVTPVRARRTVELPRGEVLEHSLDCGCLRKRGLTHRLPDPHDPLGDVSSGQHLFTFHSAILPNVGSTGMELTDLQARAVEISKLYDRHNTSAGRTEWTTGDLALGFAGDVGDLAKLVMAVDGRREIDDARNRLGHELADCLWSVLVLADRYQIDLAAEFTSMTDDLDTRLR